MNQYKILIADDRRAVRITFRTLAKTFSRTIMEAANGFELLELLKENTDTDIIFSDIEMPEMDGFEAVERIRNQFDYPVCDIPIIAVSSHKDPEFVQKCRNYGFSGVLAKPYRASDILKMIEMYCAT